MAPDERSGSHNGRHPGGFGLAHRKAGHTEFRLLRSLATAIRVCGVLEARREALECGKL